MAAGLGFKTFLSGDVLSAGDVNGYLMQGVLVFASAAARDAAITSPQEGQYAYLKDTNVTYYYSGSAWVSAGGASGSVIKQVVTGSTTTSTVIASTTLTDTTLTATITPGSASSKILVLITQQFAVSRSSTNIGAKYKVFRDATTIVDYSAAANNYAEIDLSGTVTASKILGIQSVSYYDSPASTSALVYKTQGACNNTADSGRVTFQIGAAPSLITLIEIGA